MKQKAKRILVVMLTVMIIFGYLAPLVADEANAATADLDLCDLGCELEHCDGDHCDGGHYDEENCDWGHCDEEICDGVICDGDNCDGDCYSEHCGDCECENGHCDEQCDSIGVVEVSSSSSVGRMTKEQAACSHVWNISAATCTVQKWCKKCGYVAQKALGHSTVYKETKAATCTTQGTYVYKCTRSGCGYSTGGYIPSLGHKAGAAATCTSPQKCTRCGVTLKDKLGHSYGAAATCTTAQKCTRCGVTLKNALGHSAGAAATCTTAQKCTRCGVTLKNALGHDAPYKETKAPTCTTQGEYVYKCTRCSYSTGGYIPALGHSAGAAATCTTAQKCTRCSTTLNKELGHAWDSGTVTKAATCTATGTKTFKCSRCGGTKTETINALGHSAGAAATCTAPQKCTRCNTTLKNALGHAWDNGTVTKAATCTATGTKVYKCTRSGCSATTSETIPMIAHNCEWRVTVQPSCKGSGTEQYTCKVCGTGTAWRSIQYYGDHTWVAATCTKAKTCSVCGATSGDPLGHAYSWRTTVNPTCTTVGKKEQYCTRPGCTSVVNRQDVGALGHAWDNGTVTKAATCTATGTKTFKCTRSGCTASKTETINALGHSWGAAATCTTAQTCTRCGEVNQKALGHNTTYTETKEATCTTQGEYVYKCTRCSYSTGGYIPALGHEWGAEATCTTPQKCTREGCTAVNKDALGHAWDSGTVTKAPTCTETGSKTFKCTRSGCKGSKTETIAALGHSCEWRVTVKPSCKGSGTEQYTCTVCETGTAWRSIQYYGDHTWNLESYVGAAGTSEGYETYRCSVCDATKTEAHNYQWETTAPHDCVPGKQEYKCTKCGHIRDGRSIQAYGNHTWQLKEKDETYCTCQCQICNIIVTREHFYNKTVVKEPSVESDGEALFTCVFCGDTYTEAIKRTVITYIYESSVWPFPNGWDYVEEVYTSLDEGLKKPNHTYSSTSNSTTRAVGWYEITSGKSYTSENCVGDVVNKIGDNEWLFAVKETTKSVSIGFDPAGNYRGASGEVENNGKYDIGAWEAGLTLDNLDVNQIEAPKWLRLEKIDNRKLVLSCDPGYEIRPDENYSGRQAQITITLSDGRTREVRHISVNQVLPCEYTNGKCKNNILQTMKQPDQKGYNDLAEDFDLSKAAYFNTDNSNVELVVSKDGTKVALLNREMSFYKADGSKIDDMKNVTSSLEWGNVYLYCNVQYTVLSHYEDNYGNGGNSNLPTIVYTGLKLDKSNNGEKIQKVHITIDDTKNNTVFVRSDLICDTEAAPGPSFGKLAWTIVKNTANSAVATAGIVISVAEAECCKWIVVVPVGFALAEGISGYIQKEISFDDAAAMVGTELLSTYIGAVFGDVGEVFPALETGYTYYSFASDGNSIVENEKDTREIWYDYWNQKDYSTDHWTIKGASNTIERFLNYTGEDKYLTNKCVVKLYYYNLDGQMGHQWDEHYVVTAYGKKYDFHWISNKRYELDYIEEGRISTFTLR